MRQASTTSGELPTGQHQAQHMPEQQLPQLNNPKMPIKTPLPDHQTGDFVKRTDGQFDVRKAFNERLINPSPGVEYSFEELKYFDWKKHVEILLLNQRRELELKRQLELAEQANQYQEQTHMNSSMRPPQSPTNRLSIVPQSLQPTHGDNDTSCYGNLNEAPSVIQDWFKHTLQVPGNVDKFTVPIDQSQYIREHCPTSTPNNKDDKTKRSRRMSRPSMGGSPTMKLSPINETSRDCNSKSSSSSSAISTTPATVKKPLILRPIRDEPDRPLEPNDPTTFRKLLRALAEPLDRRSGYIGVDENMPEIRKHTRIEFGDDHYIVGKELSSDSKIYMAHLLIEDSDSSGIDAPDKAVCFRVDKPSNDWLFYICHELHRRLVRQKTKPDIELSVMNADPAIMYLDGSILVDEHYRFVSLEHYLMACTEINKPLPKSIATYIALELIQLVRGMHSCDIVHMNINPRNIIITGIPCREDIASVDERTSLIKLIGFDRAMDTRLLPVDFKFENKVDYMAVSEILESRSWCHEIDWLGILSCIHKMFFLEELAPVRDSDDKWQVQKKFDGFPTNAWTTTFEGFLNFKDTQSNNSLVDQVVAEMSSWVKANSKLILKEALDLDMFLEDFCKSTRKRT